MKYLTYLATPYSPIDKSMSVSAGDVLKEWRFVTVSKVAARLMMDFGWNVFSPITHSHPFHLYGGLKGDWDFWKKIDTEFIELCCRLVVLKLPGWEESVGVTAEIKIARELNLPIFYVDFDSVTGAYKISNQPYE